MVDDSRGEKDAGSRTRRFKPRPSLANLLCAIAIMVCGAVFLMCNMYLGAIDRAMVRNVPHAIWGFAFLTLALAGVSFVTRKSVAIRVLDVLVAALVIGMALIPLA
jgi:hypothetical protein